MITRADLSRLVEAGSEGNPGVVLLGPRQCGKTTLARQIAREHAGSIFDLEDPDDAAALAAGAADRV